MVFHDASTIVRRGTQEPWRIGYWQGANIPVVFLHQSIRGKLQCTTLHSHYRNHERRSATCPLVLFRGYKLDICCSAFCLTLIYCCAPYISMIMMGFNAIVVFTNLNFIATSFIAETKTFKPLLSIYGSSECAMDSPTAVVPLSKLQVGIPSGVPESVRCAFSCERFQSCTSYNYRKLQNAANDGGQCELYTVSPMNCSIDDSCQHYQVSIYHMWPLTACEHCGVCGLPTRLRIYMYWSRIAYYI